MKQTVLVFMPGETSAVALWQIEGARDATWCQVAVPRGERGQSDNRVLTALDALLVQKQIGLSDITHVGVMHGPASYTELRLFVSTANTLAWIQGVPLFSFGPEDHVPESLPDLIPQARVNQPVEPVYPPLFGA